MLTYSELLTKYEKLELENEALRQENELLRSQLAQLSHDEVCSADVSVNSAEVETVSNFDSECNQIISVTHHSSSDEKIYLFRSLFRGSRIDGIVDNSFRHVHAVAKPVGYKIRANDAEFDCFHSVSPPVIVFPLYR